MKKATKPVDEAMTPVVKTVRVSAKVASTMARILEIRSQVRTLMKEAEALEAGVLDSVPIGQPVKLPDGSHALVRDNFAAKNLCWKSASFRRFEIELVD